MTMRYDVIVIGTGPAGMAAATHLAGAGLRVIAIDEQTEPGGQIWRAVERNSGTSLATLLGAEYLKGLPAARAFRESGAAYLSGAQLWQIEPGWTVHVMHRGRSIALSAERLVMAVGAQERPVPFPGWTLPGVLPVGAAQIALKSANQIPEGPVVVAGSGPLPLLYMRQLTMAGGRISAFLDTSPRGGKTRALRHAGAALRQPGALMKGAIWSARLRLSGTTTVADVARLRAVGEQALEGVEYTTGEGRTGFLPATTLLVHEGIIPNVHIARALGCPLVWREDQRCFQPQRQETGETPVRGLHVVGDCAGIGGAAAARAEGELAALHIARDHGAITPRAYAARGEPLRRYLSRQRSFRAFLDALFPPRLSATEPDDDTIVCRCEELSARDVRAHLSPGYVGPNQLKSYSRAGMGPCQGRQCGSTISSMISRHYAAPMSEVGLFNPRPPFKPVTVGDVASE